MSALAAYVLLDTVVSVFVVWIYWDLTRHRVGRVADADGLVNVSAGAWSVATLFLWMFTIPAYLLKRSALIARARRQPVSVEGRHQKLFMLAVAAFVPTVLLALALLS